MGCQNKTTQKSPNDKIQFLAKITIVKVKFLNIPLYFMILIGILNLDFHEIADFNMPFKLSKLLRIKKLWLIQIPSFNTGVPHTSELLILSLK